MPIEIPEHLRYHAPRPNVSFHHVASRFREPKLEIDPDLYYKMYGPYRPESPTRDSAFARTASRYMSPQPSRPSSPSRHEPPPVPARKSLNMTREYREHKAYAKVAGVSAGTAKYFDPVPIPDETPRDLVERRKQEASAACVKGDRQFGYRRVNTTSFDETRARSPEAAEAPHLYNSPSRRNAHSVVMGWVTKNIPIPGHEDELLPPRTHSPQRRGHSPRPFNAGARNASSPKLPQRPAAVKEERKIQALCNSMQTARAASPPRVAYLAPRNQGARYQSPAAARMTFARTETTSTAASVPNGTASSSAPANGVQRRGTSPTRRGPATSRGGPSRGTSPTTAGPRSGSPVRQQPSSSARVGAPRAVPRPRAVGPIDVPHTQYEEHYDTATAPSGGHRHTAPNPYTQHATYVPRDEPQQHESYQPVVTNRVASSQLLFSASLPPALVRSSSPIKND